MEKTITLTIDEIHAIREAHCQETDGMQFDEYRKLLDAEIAPILLTLHQAKEMANTSIVSPVQRMAAD